jgi:hypothetical protein
MAHLLTMRRHPWLAAFFAFGAIMCGLTIILLAFPGTVLDSLWRLNPSARIAFESISPWSIGLMLIVGLACASAAIGLGTGAAWGVRLALIILSVNATADLLNAFVRHDYRALIGLPVAGIMIWWLARSRYLKLRSNGSRL